MTSFARCTAALVCLLALAVLPAPTARAAAPSPARPGHGWYLVQVTGAADGDGDHPQSVVLVGPRGQRRLVVDLGVPQGQEFVHLSDWSADGRRALVVHAYGDAPRAVVVDVATGATVAEVPLPDTADSATFDGADDGLLVDLYDAPGNASWVRHYPLDGSVPGPRVLTESPGRTALAGPDGTFVTTGAPGHPRVLRVVDEATGSVRSRLRLPESYCAPERWWDVDRVLLVCTNGGSSELLLADPTTRRVTRVTKPRPFSDEDYGTVDARRTQQGLVLEISTYFDDVLARVDRRGRLHGVPVQGHGQRAQVLVGATRTKIVVVRTSALFSEHPIAPSLRMVDPVTGRGRTLLGLPAGAGFQAVLGYRESPAAG